MATRKICCRATVTIIGDEKPLGWCPNNFNTKNDLSTLAAPVGRVENLRSIIQGFVPAQQNEHIADG